MGKTAHRLNKGSIGTAAALLAVIVTTVAPAHAGTNFPAIQNYPAPNCAKPGRQPPLPDRNDPVHYGAAVQKIAEYGAAELAYGACIDAYIANAEADLALIRGKASTATPNFPALNNYPTPDCGPTMSQPVPPVLGNAGSYAAERAMKDYNAQVVKYDVYASCRNTYTANAQADIDLIRNKVNNAAAGNVSAPAVSGPSGWVTFKTGKSVFGPTQHQIDRKTIRQEGPYLTFWTRIWIVPLQQGLVHNDVADERLTRWSEKFAVDCAHHKWGPQFIDSTDPIERDERVSLKTMPWDSLDDAPVVAQVVCTPAAAAAGAKTP